MTKVTIALNAQTVRRIDRLVRDGRSPNRSQAIDAAVLAHVGRLDPSRLAVECAKLDPAAEKSLAEAGLALFAGECE